MVMIKTKRPKVEKNMKLQFEEDILKVLRKYGMVKKGQLVNKAKIFVETNKIPFVELERCII